MLDDSAKTKTAVTAGNGDVGIVLSGAFPKTCPLTLAPSSLRVEQGGGPGGQKINKVRNCVQLTHVPSGVSVSCQDSRELHANRHIARKRLKEKVQGPFTERATT